MSIAEIKITIATTAPERLDKLLVQNAPEALGLSRSRIQELIQSGQVFQEGKPVLDAKKKARDGEVYVIKLPPPRAYEVEAENLDIEIVYEDDAILVVNKAAGMVVHPALSAPSGTLVNALLYHAGDRLSGIGGVERPGIVHRIDKDTSGLLVIAKTDRAHEGLGKQFRAHSIERVYQAYVYGDLRAGDARILGLEGVSREGANGLRIDLPIGRHKTDRLRQAIRSDGRHAVTHVQLGAQDAHHLVSKVECRLETGRTHQIRVHLNHIGHALLGDPVYGKGARQLPKTAPEALLADIAALQGQALHAGVLGFEHPVTGEPMRFEAELPEDLARLDRWFG